MSRTVCTCALLMLAAGRMSFAQSPASRSSWLMQNYRFTGPPAPGSVRPIDPVVNELWRVQNAVQWILQRAKSDQDYETALAAAWQAAENAQAIGAVTERREAAAAAKAFAEQQQALGAARGAAPPSPQYLIAFRDHTVEIAAKYWTEGPLLHYLTPTGAHVQTFLDRVDRGLSIRLNRELNLEFRLPE
jgi:hypothetical protein